MTLARDGGANPNDVFDGSGTLSLSDGQVLLQEIEGQSSEPIDIIVGTYTNADGALVITFNADATGARVNAVLEQLVYGYGGEAPPPTAEIDYAFDDGQSPVATGSITVTLVGENDPPSLDSVTPAAAYRPGSPGAVLSPSLVITDLDSTTLASAVVQIVDRPDEPLIPETSTDTPDADDVLSADPGSTGIDVPYNPATHVLTLSGTATLDQYRQVLATVAYSSTGCRSEPGRRKHDPQHQVAARRRRPQRQPERRPDHHAPLQPVARSRRRGRRRRLRDRLHRERPGRADRRHGCGRHERGRQPDLRNDHPDEREARRQPRHRRRAAGWDHRHGRHHVGSGPDHRRARRSNLAGELPGGAAPSGVRQLERKPRHGTPRHHGRGRRRDRDQQHRPHDDTVTAVNDAPVAQAGSASGNEDTTIFGNAVATDADNSAAQLTYSLVGVNGGATHGTVALNPDGSFTYAPAADFNGGDSFSFKANDGALDSNTASVAITVAPVNDAPVLGGDDAITVAKGGAVAVTTADLTASDLDNTPAELVYTVTGTIARHRRRSGAATASFTQADLAANLVSFQHDGSGAAGGFAVS